MRLNGRFVGEFDDELDFKRVHWKKKDGTVMRIADMDDEHLRNALRMVENKARGIGVADTIAMIKGAVPGLLQEWRRRGFDEGGWR